MPHNPFKLAFPSATLPPQLGGLRCVVLFSIQKPDEPNISFGFCIDEKGRFHQEVPFVTNDIRGAKPIVLVEDPNAVAPQVGGGSGLVGPGGQRL